MPVSPQRWIKELLRDKRKTVGRLDSRFTGMDADAAGERYEYDSSEASYEGAYSAMFQDYVRKELKWNTEGYYAINGSVRPWDNGQPGAPAEALRSAMTEHAVPIIRPEDFTAPPIVDVVRKRSFVIAAPAYMVARSTRLYSSNYL